ncbi:RNA polymerase subunit sigma-70 [Pedobacter psychrophilus]|uniref:RNA polymerase subunit sigma-70 n=1 Tax=Pedobacter psychrophilus TaxID=1826909 RepID=A0A179DMC2_9SPHI|nr:RNA polymerase sigma factor [Pedobacter psychrophilus]OAQ41870.1 RNA polymerase subunit sigma-70 [Pedobacter psychrophilus]
MDNTQLLKLLEDCKNRKRLAQKELYKNFFGYALKICLRYSNDKNEAIEMVNDGFMKVYNKLHLYNENYEFKSWLGKIMINTAIDHYRQKIKKLNMEDLDKIEDQGKEDNILAGLKYQDLLKLIQKLSIAYRTVFNLFVIDGFSHIEISEKLSISEGTSKSNLFKARQQLKEMILQVENH